MNYIILNVTRFKSRLGLVVILHISHLVACVEVQPVVAHSLQSTAIILDYLWCKSELGW